MRASAGSGGTACTSYGRPMPWLEAFCTVAGAARVSYTRRHPQQSPVTAHATLVGILTTPLFRSTCGIPYLYPTASRPLPSRPTFSADISWKWKSHRLPFTTRCVRSSHSVFSLSFLSRNSASSRSLATCRSVLCCRSKPSSFHFSKSTSMGRGIRSSAGRSLEENTFAASSRVNWRDSDAG